MKVYAGGHYHVYVDWADFRLLPTKPLKAPVQGADGGKSTNKKFVLKLDRKAISPIDEYIPKNAGWDKIREVHYTITQEQYERLRDDGLDVERIGGGTSIDLHLEEDLSNFV